MTLPQRFTISIIRLYQRTLSPDHGVFRHSTCRFTPTCSEYAIEAIQAFGLSRGSFKAIRRISRCHPFAKAGFDPIS